MELIKMKRLLQQKFHCFVRFFSREKKNLEILFFSCNFFLKKMSEKPHQLCYIQKIIIKKIIKKILNEAEAQ
jgi:hypothetical protein